MGGGSLSGRRMAAMSPGPSESTLGSNGRSRLRLAAGGFASGLFLSLVLVVPPPASAHFGCSDVGQILGNASANNLEGDTHGGGGPDDHDHRDYIDGLGGDDKIRGHTCGDDLFGSQGRDIVWGANGMDDMHGGDGGESGCDTNPFGCANLDAGDGDDGAHGGDGNDDVKSGSTTQDADGLFGNAGDNDDVNGNDQDTQDTVGGGPGSNDECWFDFAPEIPPRQDNTNECEDLHPV